MADMLTQVLLAIPKIFMAIVILFVAYMVARVIADLVTRLLTNAGFDNLVSRLSMGEIAEQPSVGPSRIVGYLVLFVIMVFATLAVSDLIGWTAFTVILTTFIAFLARLALSFVIVVIGIYLANFATRLILASRLKQTKRAGAAGPHGDHRLRGGDGAGSAGRRQRRRQPDLWSGAGRGARWRQPWPSAWAARTWPSSSWCAGTGAPKPAWPPKRRRRPRNLPQPMPACPQRRCPTLICPTPICPTRHSSPTSTRHGREHPAPCCPGGLTEGPPGQHA